MCVCVCARVFPYQILFQVVLILRQADNCNHSHDDYTQDIRKMLDYGQDIIDAATMMMMILILILIMIMMVVQR